MTKTKWCFATVLVIALAVTAAVAQKAGKPLTKSQVASHLAEEAEISKKQAAAILESIATLAYKQAPDGSKRPLLPDSRPLHDQRGLFEIAKGQLRFFWIHWTHVRTHVPHYNVMLLLDVVEKKTDKLHPDVISRVRQLRREALANYPGPCDWFGVDRERETSAPTSQ